MKDLRQIGKIIGLPLYVDVAMVHPIDKDKKAELADKILKRAFGMIEPKVKRICRPQKNKDDIPVFARSKDELTTQSDNTLDELRAEVLVEFKQVLKLAPADYTENCTNVVMSMFEGHVAAQNLALLTRLEAEPTIADLFPTHPENNPDSYDDMVSVVKWYKSKFQSERALIEKRMI